MKVLIAVRTGSCNNPWRLIRIEFGHDLQKEGPDLHVYGSANFVQALLKHDLVDAFWLKIFPITLGGGKRKNDVAAYQYFSAGRISIAPPRRAAGTRAATLIAASTFSASRTKYPPTAPRTST